MNKYKGYLEITDRAQKFIDSGLARIEGANVVWNPGSGNTGVVEWGKFYVSDSAEGEDLATLAAGAAIGVAATVGIGMIIYRSVKLRQNEADRINNNLISCLSMYILESCENNVKLSTKLDLKLAIKEYMDNFKLFKNKVDLNLLKSLDFAINDLELDDKFELNDNIIQLKDFLEVNHPKKEQEIS